jgi:hypothetical protein
VVCPALPPGTGTPEGAPSAMKRKPSARRMSWHSMERGAPSGRKRELPGAIKGGRKSGGNFADWGRPVCVSFLRKQESRSYLPPGFLLPGQPHPLPGQPHPPPSCRLAGRSTAMGERGSFIRVTWQKKRREKTNKLSKIDKMRVSAKLRDGDNIGRLVKLRKDPWKW